jgi:hypothetical protein
MLAKDAGIGPTFVERRSYPHNPAAAAAQDRRAGEARQRVKDLREKACAEIDRLIAFMDLTDGYATDELEEDGDFEPGLGWTRGGATGGTLDLEEGFSHVGN